ncbi:MAG TPA: hypothetical protein PKA28_04550 [Methylomusa anaerophila]|uniref:hypothetical protein n=1 Tax=Methylomusa anaerophila TaxID=1930071 RepID=UPI0013156AD8|nr:hypothetical protein [Methylomusa anaerophila]HML87698.1 hypothetical protein [Methylomusa anaerophila]
MRLADHKPFMLPPWLRVVVSNRSSQMKNKRSFDLRNYAAGFLLLFSHPAASL